MSPDVNSQGFGASFGNLKISQPAWSAVTLSVMIFYLLGGCNASRPHNGNEFPDTGPRQEQLYPDCEPRNSNTPGAAHTNESKIIP